jgi:glucosamine--fructose-6-phosphate aminotransferase (isomerizing)
VEFTEEGWLVCGIFGCVLREGKAAPIIHQALKRLEYRGYDSVGVATIYDGRLQIKKDSGCVDDVHKKLDLNDLNGVIGIGHTRWATHGAPLMINAHPHTDCEGKIAVVHNGILENYSDLKAELLVRGHLFASRTDTEVVPHLIEDYMKQGFAFLDGVRETVKRLEGSYALAIIHANEPDKIVCARSQSPIVIGASDIDSCVSSDIPTVLPLTNKILDVQNGELGILTANTLNLVRISDGTPIQRDLRTITWDVELAQKQGYPHFMLKEIHEQPRCLEDAMRLQRRYIDLITTFLDRSREIYLLACGTSYNACLAAAYMFSNLCNLSTHPIIASEFIEQYGNAVNIESTILAVSQSGETADILNAIDHARFKAATILGLTNTIGSTLTRVSRAYICQQSGPEIGVAATKTFTSQLLVLAQLALSLAEVRGKVSQERIDEFEVKLNEITHIAETVINTQEEKVKTVVEKYRTAKCFYFLGRGINTATALEGRLKLLELAYVPSIAYPAGESKHGPISLIQEGFPAIFVCPKNETRKALIGNIMEMKARGAKIIAVLDEEDQEVKNLADDYFEIPTGIPEILSPIPYVIPLQLFAYYMALARNCDPDKPKNLAKSVTVL